MEIPSTTKAHCILSKLGTSRPHSVTFQGLEAQVAPSASMLKQASFFAVLYPTYDLGDALADVTRSVPLIQACANVVLYLLLEVGIGKDGVM